MELSSHLPYRPAPELQEVLDDLKRLGNPLDDLTPGSAAALWMQREILSRKVLAPIPMTFRDLFIPARNRQIPIRVYTPPGNELARDGRQPVVLYVHGGGWTLGSIATYDSLARGLAERVPAMVISVDYRLAPEHPFPAALEDVHLVLEWVIRNIAELGGDPERLALAGDSAGAALATVVALRATKEGLPIAIQALFYPSTNIARTDWTSYQQYGEHHWLTRKAVESFRGFYLPSPKDWHNPEAAPLLLSDDDLRLMPPAYIVTCGCDPLRDEGAAYAQRLGDNGVVVEYCLHEQMIHACLSLFNSAAYPRASRRVEPLLADAAMTLHAAFAATQRI